MAQGTLAIPPYVTKLEAALKKKLPRAKIEHELVRPNRYRLFVVWSGFENMGHPERQEIVWNLADKVLDHDDLLKISMIITVGAKEWATKKSDWE